MPRLRLRTRFLLSMLLVTAALTTTSLLLVQRSIRKNVRTSIAVNLRNSVAAFQDFSHERETMLTSDVALLADLPITRAIMTSPDPVTIQDASQHISQIANSDLFVLVDRNGRVVALHTKTPGFTRRRGGKIFPPVPRRRSGRIQPLVVGRTPSLPDFYRAYLSRHQD